MGALQGPEVDGLPLLPRLALFLPNLAGGGAERVTLNLARGLVELGAEVELVLVNATGELMRDVPAGVKVASLGRERTLTAVPALAAYLRSARPDGLLSAMNHANVAALWSAMLAGYRGRVMVAEHVQLPPSSKGLWQRAFNLAIRLTYPVAHRIIAVSHGVKESLRRNGVRPERVEVIYNPVIGSELDSSPRHRPSSLPVDQGPVILGMGRLAPQKNFPLLLRAFAAVRSRRPAKLMILGEGPERAALEALAEELGVAEDVMLPGFVANPYDFLAHADLFVLSSDYEGLPTVLIEALALGAPVVSTDCPSGPHEILNGGEFGRLVPPRDAEALAEAIDASLDSPPVATSARWLDQFRERRAAERYLEAFGFEMPGD